MLPFKLVYSDDYYLPIGTHVFPAEKYQRIHKRLLESGVAEANDFVSPQSGVGSGHPAGAHAAVCAEAEDGDAFGARGTGDGDSLLAGTGAGVLAGGGWVDAGGGLCAEGSRRLQHWRRISSCVPGSWRRLLHDSRRGRGDPPDAARRQDPYGDDGGLRCPPGQWDGGDFCGGARAERSAAVGGSATVTAARPAKLRNAHAGDVFTISLHQENNYPAWKPPSSIDVDLPDEIGDDDYLAWLDNALSSGLRQFEPDLMCYIAGADPYREDQLGGLSLTIEGLKKRDELVFRVARARDIPVMVTLRGRVRAEGG